LLLIQIQPHHSFYADTYLYADTYHSTKAGIDAVVVAAAAAVALTGAAAFFQLNDTAVAWAALAGRYRIEGLSLVMSGLQKYLNLLLLLLLLLLFLRTPCALGPNDAGGTAVV
jgi:hypothetical protein